MKYLPLYLLIPLFTLGITSVFSQNIKILKQNEQIQMAKAIEFIACPWETGSLPLHFPVLMS